MATSSIYTNVVIKNKAACRKLVKALESATKSKKKEVKFSRPPEMVEGEKIKEIFKDVK